MKAIMVMFDTLNRHLLAPYGCQWTHTPNFQRLAEKSVMFDNCYIGSMPCMPARRELHTGRYNFLHRSWGPLEPFDDSMPEILQENGVYTHLVSDHTHYWEDGGGTYHTRYCSWEFSRGQEGDPWKGEVSDPEAPRHAGDKTLGNRFWRQDWVNRKYIRKEEDFPQAKTFQSGMDFIRANCKEKRWFLQLETFDPHEPFYAAQKYRDLYPHAYSGKHFDWPDYKRVVETTAEVMHCRYEYAALLSMCDAYLGKILDLMDELNLWQDTMLIVNTDHGFLLGEHDWWAKCVQPFYGEVAHIPLFIWDPRTGKKAERRQSLVQTIDLAPTLLHYFGAQIPVDMRGKELSRVIDNDVPTREACLFGMHGGHVNVTDGRYVYMKAPESPTNKPLYNYTLMPTHMRCFFEKTEFEEMELADPLPFTKGINVLRTPASSGIDHHAFGDLLFDLAHDPEQLQPIRDAGQERRLQRLMVNLMKDSDAPEEQYVRLGLHPAR